MSSESELTVDVTSTAGPSWETPWCPLLVEHFRHWRERTGGDWQEFVTMLDDLSDEE